MDRAKSAGSMSWKLNAPALRLTVADVNMMRSNRRNRLVARNLEQRWNEALARVSRLQDAMDELEPSSPALSDQDQAALAQLASDLPRLWQHEAAPFDLKKRIVRAVIKEIVVTVEATRLRVSDPLARRPAQRI